MISYVMELLSTIDSYTSVTILKDLTLPNVHDALCFDIRVL